MTFVAFDVLTAAQLNAILPMIAYKDADQTVNNSTTFVDDDDIFVTVAANTTYLGRLVMSYVGAPGADLKAQLVFPSGIMHAASIGPQATTSAATNPPETTVRWQTALNSASPTAFVFGCHASGGGTSLSVSAIVDFTLIVGVTGGTLKLQWAQNAANASNLVMLRGTSISLTRKP